MEGTTDQLVPRLAVGVAKSFIVPQYQCTSLIAVLALALLQNTTSACLRILPPRPQGHLTPNPSHLAGLVLASLTMLLSAGVEHTRLGSFSAAHGRPNHRAVAPTTPLRNPLPHHLPSHPAGHPVGGIGYLGGPGGPENVIASRQLASRKLQTESGVAGPWGAAAQWAWWEGGGAWGEAWVSGGTEGSDRGARW